VLVVGAGAVGDQVARNLVSRGARIACVANRTRERARELAQRYGAEPLALDEVEAELPHTDVLVASTSAPGYLIGRDQLERALRRRRGEPLLCIDIAVPRDLDPAIHELAGCYLYDIDDLQSVVAESLVGRRREAARAEAIVAQEADRFGSWLSSLDVVPAIASLRARAEEIRAAELERAAGRLGRLSDTERRAVEAITARIVDKLLHLPTVRMKEAAATPAGAVYADAVQHLFGLDDDER
jgi:glutamyl-tRNA reductase